MSAAVFSQSKMIRLELRKHNTAENTDCCFFMVKSYHSDSTIQRKVHPKGITILYAVTDRQLSFPVLLHRTVSLLFGNSQRVLMMEVYFSRVNFLCWLFFFLCPFHPRGAAVARKRPWSCQTCNWQVKNTHKQLTQRSQSGLTVLSRQRVGV